MVIGAGFIDLEPAEQLHCKDLSVQLVELQKQVFPPQDAPMTALLESELRHHNIAITLRDDVARFQQEDDYVRCQLTSGKVLEADLLVLSISVKAGTELARAFDVPLE